MNPAPIALFVYNRLHHTKRTVEALQKNPLAGNSDLYIFSDGPKNAESRQSVEAVRAYVHSITGFKRVNVVERTKNFGLAGNIIDGVTSIVNRHGEVIVLEDDMQTSPYFLQYMNEALEMYRNNDRVVCIHAYLYPVKEKLPETFFLKGADCWGWATWKRGWDLFEPDGKKLLDELVRKKLTKDFDFDGVYDYTLMLSNQVKGLNNSWAIRWYASAYLQDRLTLYPGRSLLQNIGNDGSGVHSSPTNHFDVKLSERPVEVTEIPATVSASGRAAFVNYFKAIRPGLIARILSKLKTTVKNVITKEA